MSQDVYRVGMFKLPACFAEPKNDPTGVEYWNEILKWWLGLPSQFEDKPVPIKWCHKWLCHYQRKQFDQVHPLIKLLLSDECQRPELYKYDKTYFNEVWTTLESIEWLSDETLADPVELRYFEAFVGLTDFRLKYPVDRKHERLSYHGAYLNYIVSLCCVEQLQIAFGWGLSPILYDILLEEARLEDATCGNYSTRNPEGVVGRHWFKTPDFGLQL